MTLNTREIEAPDPLARSLQAVVEAAPNDDPIGEKMVINMGPSHPATHGVLRLVLELDGELVTKATRVRLSPSRRRKDRGEYAI